MMYLSRFLVVAFLLNTVLAQFNLTLLISELPACSIECSQQSLPAAGCAFEDIPNCLCTNVTLQAQLTTCVHVTCNIADQFTATSVSQNLMCKGVPQPSRSGEVKRVAIIVAAFGFPMVILRLVSRYISSKLWWDDWVIVAAAVCMVPMTFIALYNSSRGFGNHVWDVPPENISSLQELYYVSQILYVVTQNLAKGSILLLFLRIFPDKRFCLVTKICLAWIVCHTIAFTIAVILQCHPISSIWDSSLKGKCYNSTAIVFAGAAFSIIEDIMIILLPVRELKNLNLPPRKKITVIFMFALGSFACITSIVRLKYITTYEVESLDQTWTNTDVVIWSTIEVYTAVICASMMAARPLLVKCMPVLFQNTIESRKEGAYGSSNPHRVESKSVGAHWSRKHGSAIKLKSTDSAEGTRVWTGGKSSHERWGRGAGGLEVWVTTSIELGDTDHALSDQSQRESSGS